MPTNDKTKQRMKIAADGCAAMLRAEGWEGSGVFISHEGTTAWAYQMKPDGNEGRSLIEVMRGALAGVYNMYKILKLKVPKPEDLQPDNFTIQVLGKDVPCPK